MSHNYFQNLREEEVFSGSLNQGSELFTIMGYESQQILVCSLVLSFLDVFSQIFEQNFSSDLLLDDPQVIEIYQDLLQEYF